MPRRWRTTPTYPRRGFWPRRATTSLQPLNAARLYVTSLVDRHGSGEDARLVGNVDASLEAVEEILGALLDISRLDSGGMKPEIMHFRIDELTAPA